MKNLTNGKKIALLGVCTAIVMAATLILRIPAVAGGYINFGDTFIFLFAYLFGPYFALIVGALGSALADIFAGAIIWSPYTLVIKGLEGLISGIFFTKVLFGRVKLNVLSATLAFIIGGLFMAVGYYFATAIILGSFSGALASIPENLIQAGVSVVVAILLLFVFKAKNIKFKN